MGFTGDADEEIKIRDWANRPSTQQAVKSLALLPARGRLCPLGLGVPSGAQSESQKPSPSLRCACVVSAGHCYLHPSLELDRSSIFAARLQCTKEKWCSTTSRLILYILYYIIIFIYFIYIHTHTYIQIYIYVCMYMICENNAGQIDQSAQIATLLIHDFSYIPSHHYLESSPSSHLHPPQLPIK